MGVYGFITDGDSGDSVLANNPDLSTDAGQFAMIESVKSTDNSVTFEFVAAIPKERVSSALDKVFYFVLCKIALFIFTNTASRVTTCRISHNTTTGLDPLISNL